MAVVLENWLKALTATLSATTSYSAGTLSIPIGELALYYGKARHEPARIDLLNATEIELQKLAHACDAIPEVGDTKQDQKAGKLDAADFATKLGDSGTLQKLLDIIRPDMVQGRDDNQTIVAELHRLHVYGEGASLKPNAGKSPNENMLGSLVITFPTPHEGGALVLGHAGQEWAHDTAPLLLFNGRPQGPRVAYAAFGSEVAHEIALVRSGYLVTLTYHLYLDNDHRASAAMRDALKGLSRSSHPSEAAFRAALEQGVKDMSIMPEGGLLGFGLAHSYTLPSTRQRDTIPVDIMARNLQGIDAITYGVCKAAGLEARTMVLFEDYEHGAVLSTRIRDIDWEHDNLLNELKGDDGLLVERQDPEDEDEYNSDLDDEEQTDRQKVNWVTPITKSTMVKSHYVTQEEGQLDCIEGHLCLIVRIGDGNKRCS